MSQADASQLVHTTESGQPRLTLAVETPSSASPFPSPSSTFFPPPIPSSHEFANRIVNNKRYRAKSVGNKDRDKERPRVQKLSFTASDAAVLTDDTDTSKLPSTRSAGASPANATTLLPAFTPSDNSSTTPTSAASLASLGSSASRLHAAPSTASLSGSVSQSIPPVVTVVDAASNSLVPPVPRDSSVPTSAMAVPSPVASPVTLALYPVTRPADDERIPHPPAPQALPAQSLNPSDSLLKLHAQEGSTNTITPASTQVLTPTPSRDEPDINYDGASTPVARQRPESTASLFTALVGAGSLSRASSLSSSRPAPPSPAPSRRASQHLIQRNSSLRRSTSSISSATGGGANLGRSASARSTTNKRTSTFSSMSSLTPPIDTTISGLQVTTLSPTIEQHTAVEENQPPRPIIVRDFAYAAQDYWFSARPIDLLPRRERESKRDSSTSRSSRGLGGWGPYSSSSKALGAKSGKKKKKGGWAALGKFLSKRSSGQPEWGSEDLSEDEDDEDHGPYEDEDDRIGSDNGYYDDDGGGGEPVEEELKPGLYRALYPFEPEGTAEMALVEDQIVRVIARGGGVGWAIVERPPEQGDGVGGFGLEAAGQALVPESYLEPYRLDDEDEYDD